MSRAESPCWNLAHPTSREETARKGMPVWPCRERGWHSTSPLQTQAHGHPLSLWPALSPGDMSFTFGPVFAPLLPPPSPL